jgi:hypothetical protein
MFQVRRSLWQGGPHQMSQRAYKVRRSIQRKRLFGDGALVLVIKLGRDFRWLVLVIKLGRDFRWLVLGRRPD